jgi:opacity protein-like surface antigen
MNRTIAAVVASLSLLGANRTFAQAERVGQGAVEITVIPGGGTFFAEKGRSPSFGNYDVGGSLTYNVNRILAVEGEVGGTLGISQNLQFGGGTGSVKTPNLVNYSGSVIVSVPTNSPVVPYVSGGVGGLTLLKTTGLGINDMTTFLTGSVGGGVKWYANNRWGLRADYRFIAVQSKDTAPAFFGQDLRYGHRVYGGVIINAGL